MPKVNLRIAGAGKETGALLKQYLTSRGLTVVKEGAPISISYGISLEDGPKVLNANVGGGDKIKRLKQMNAGGVRTVPWFEGTSIPAGFKFPALARAIAGHGGEDIMPVFQAQEVPWRVAAGFAWFSSYVPFKTEYRAWAFRDKILDVYEKVMERPDEYKFVAGRNFRQGFEFKKITDGLGRLLANEIGSQSKAVLKAVKFDFAAIDMLLGEDGKIYVLEANTAPGVLRSHCESTLAKLADEMVAWVHDGCPQRNY